MQCYQLDHFSLCFTLINRNLLFYQLMCNLIHAEEYIYLVMHHKHNHRMQKAFCIINSIIFLSSLLLYKKSFLLYQMLYEFT